MTIATVTGILKLGLDPEVAALCKRLQGNLPSVALPLATNDLHVTLLHQNTVKPFKACLKQIVLPPGPRIELEERVYRVVRPDKQSWIACVKNSDDLRDYIGHIENLVKQTLELQERPKLIEDRVYHVSLANLTASPFDSVGDVNPKDIQA